MAKRLAILNARAGPILIGRGQTSRVLRDKHGLSALTRALMLKPRSSKLSYNVQFYLDLDGPVPIPIAKRFEHTWNCAPMFRLALGGDGINDLDGKSCSKILPVLRRAVDHMRHSDNSAEYSSMNPANGFGSHQSATRFLQDILEQCEAMPKAMIRVN